MFPDLGSTQQQAAILVGFFLPLLLAIPIQSHWPTSLKTLFSVAAYAAAGALTATAAGTLTGKTFWQSTLEILVLGVVGYQGVWKPSGLAPAIETHTNALTPAAAGNANDASSTAASDDAGTPATPPANPSPLAPSVEALLVAGARVLDQASRRLSATAPAGATSTERDEPAPDEHAAPDDLAPNEPLAANEPLTPDEPPPPNEHLAPNEPLPPKEHLAADAETVDHNASPESAAAGWIRPIRG